MTTTTKTTTNSVSITVTTEAQVAALVDKAYTLFSVMGFDGAEASIMTDQQMAEDPCYGWDIPPRAFVSWNHILVTFFDATPEDMVDSYGEGYMLEASFDEALGGGSHMQNVGSLDQLWVACLGIWTRAKDAGITHMIEEGLDADLVEDSLDEALEGYMGLQ